MQGEHKPEQVQPVIKSQKEQHLIDRVISKLSSILGNTHHKIFKTQVIERIVREKNFYVCEFLYRQKAKNGYTKTAQALLRAMKKVAQTPEQEERYEAYKRNEMPEKSLKHSNEDDESDG